MRHLTPKIRQTALYIFLLVAVVLGMTLTRRCNTGTLLPPTTTGGSGGDTVDVAIIYGPMSYYLYADTLGGLNYDLLRDFARHTDTPLRFWPVVNLDDALDMLDNGTFDILASLPSDNSVKQRFLTTRSIFLDRMVLVQLADSSGAVKIKSALDLAGDSIHIQADSPAEQRLRNMSSEIGAPIHVVSERDLSEEYLCMKVAAGELSLAVVNEKVAESMKRRYPRLSYENPVSFTQFQVWLINKNDSALLRRTDAWLDSIIGSETFETLSDRYSR